MAAAAIPAIASAISKYGPLALKYGPVVAQALPEIADIASGAYGTGKKLANLLFSSKGRQNLVQMLSSSEGRRNILEKASKYAGKGAIAGHSLLNIAGKFGADESTIGQGRGILSKGHQGFQSTLAQLASYPGMV